MVLFSLSPLSPSSFLYKTHRIKGLLRIQEMQVQTFPTDFLPKLK